MPPKTAKHGGARKNGGRKSKSGEFSNDKTPEEKLKSHRERMAKNRGQLKVPAARSDDGKDCESVRIGTGRTKKLPCCRWCKECGGRTLKDFDNWEETLQAKW